MIRKNQVRPFYREVLGDAIKTAWADRTLWPFALAAGILQTGGIFDVILTAFRESLMRPRLVYGLRVWSMPWSSLSGWALVSKLEYFMFGLFVVVGILLCSVVAQGALMAGLHQRVRGKLPKFHTLISAAGKGFWRLVALNVITIVLLWFSKFILLSPVAWTVSSPSVPTVLLYLLTSILFFLAVILFTSIHLLALSAIVLHDASLLEALKRGYAAATNRWLIVLETAAALFAVGAGVLFFAILILFVAELPVAGIMSLAVFFQHAGLFWTGYGIGLALFLLVFLSAAAMTILFQYAVWSSLYRRLCEGTLLSKVERAVHWLIGHA